ncbi:hypothetical protein [Neobacillus endophyticus]|nr:hypothetical protein [Neobacillus endophyticus]
MSLVLIELCLLVTKKQVTVYKAINRAEYRKLKDLFENGESGGVLEFY